MLLRRNIVHFWRRNLGVVLGAGICTMVLAGALVVGDSVRESLRRIAENRVGSVESLLFTEDRFFRSALADDLGKKLQATAAPVFILRGSVSNPDAEEEAGQIARVANIQVLGIDERFFKLAPDDPAPALPIEEGKVYINTRLANRLGVNKDSILNLRLEEPALFSRDAPLSGTSDKVARISRQKVSKVLSPGEFGNFALHGSQIPPYTLFIPIQTLREGLEAEGEKANLLLIGKSALPDYSTGKANQFLEETWTTGDAGILAHKVNNGASWSLRSGSIFISRILEQGFRKVNPDKNAGVLTYLVNSFNAGDKSAPYSFAAAYEPGASPNLPDDLGNDEILLNQWLADDLNLQPGAKVTLKYFIPRDRRELKEVASTFTVRSILPMPEKFSKGQESGWTPAFPGLSDEENCRDWEPGFAIEESRIRDKDENYWDDYRATPKAYVNLTAGKKMWSNRWGQATGIRIPATDLDRTALDGVIKEHITAADAGLHFEALREKALAAINGPIDFGQLFTGFSFFIILAALALTGMLFVFSIEQRNQQAGVLLAIGYSVGKVRNLFLQEGVVLAIQGSLLGCALGLLYAKAVLWGLANVWDEATGSMQFGFQIRPESLVQGALGGILMAAIALWFTMRKQLRREPLELLQAGDQLEISGQLRKDRGKIPLLISFALFFGGLIFIIFNGGIGTTGNSNVFFFTGFLYLIACICFFKYRLARIPLHMDDLPNISILGFRNTARRSGRSLVTIGVLAAGVFMVVAVSSFHVSSEKDWTNERSGTGGFAIVAESAIPIYDDLNSVRGREEFGLDEEKLAKTRIVPFRVREGDDASCLNLNRASNPTLLGVNPGDLRGRFSFGKTSQKTDDPWILLANNPESADILPGIADQNTVMYALHQKLGGLIDYKDENGRPFQVRIVGMVTGSLLQGRILIAEKNFIQKFPAQAGYRFFLADCPAGKIDNVVAHLSNTLRDQGLEARPAWQTLAAFLAVQNTYLAIFQALGGLGLLLGTAGLGIVVARNLLERRREFGLFEALGYSLKSIRRMVIIEHRWLMLWGLISGAGTALIAVLPAIRSRQEGLPFGEFSLLVIALGAASLFWIWIATRISLKGSAIPDLREE